MVSSFNSEHRAILVILKDDVVSTALGFKTVSHAVSVVEGQLFSADASKTFNLLTDVFEKGVNVGDERLLITDLDTYLDTYVDDEDGE